MYTLSAAQIFMLFFIMLGPLRMIAPFAQATQSLDGAALRALAVRTALISAAILVFGGFAGGMFLEKWRISVPVLQLVGGIIFFLVSMQMIILPHSGKDVAPPAPASTPSKSMKAFPLVITPYGMAAVIVLLSVSQDDPPRTIVILGMLLLNMLLNFLAMRHVRSVVGMAGPVLPALGYFLGVLQAALAMQISLDALDRLGILTMIH